MRVVKAPSTTSLTAGWLCIPWMMGRALRSAVYMSATISWIRIEAWGPMMAHEMYLFLAYGEKRSRGNKVKVVF
jgi:hypothetical protein